MRIFTALLMGFFLSLLFNVLLNLCFVDPGPPETMLVSLLLVFLPGWIFATLLLLNQAPQVSQVVKKGFLLAAGEWLLAILVSLLFSVRAASLVQNTAVGAIAGTLSTVFAAGFCFFMVLLCLAGYAITYLWAREREVAG